MPISQDSQPFTGARVGQSDRSKWLTCVWLKHSRSVSPPISCRGTRRFRVAGGLSRVSQPPRPSTRSLRLLARDGRRGPVYIQRRAFPATPSSAICARTEGMRGGPLLGTALLSPIAPSAAAVSRGVPRGAVNKSAPSDRLVAADRPRCVNLPAPSSAKRGGGWR